MITEILFWLFFLSLFLCVGLVPPRWISIANLWNHVVTNIDFESHLSPFLSTKVYARHFSLQWFNKLDLSLGLPVCHVCTTWEFQLLHEEVNFVGSLPADFLTWVDPGLYLLFFMPCETVKLKSNFLSRKRPALVLFLILVSCFFFILEI